MLAFQGVLKLILQELTFQPISCLFSAFAKNYDFLLFAVICRPTYSFTVSLSNNVVNNLLQLVKNICFFFKAFSNSMVYQMWSLNCRVL